MKSLGLARTAQVKRDARIGEAEAQRDAGIKVPCTNITVVSYYFSVTQITISYIKLGWDFPQIHLFTLDFVSFGFLVVPCISSQIE